MLANINKENAKTQTIQKGDKEDKTLVKAEGDHEVLVKVFEVSYTRH